MTTSPNASSGGGCWYSRPPVLGWPSPLTVWPDMPTPLADVVNFFATTSMAQVMVFALIVVFLQFRPAGLFPQKGRMVEA